jgi:hypothetical protein
VPASSSSGVNVLIGGQTAIFDDFAGAKLALFIGVAVLLSFLLLTAVFRRLLIPALAALILAHGRRFLRRHHRRLSVGLGRDPARDRTDRSLLPGPLSDSR